MDLEVSLTTANHSSVPLGDACIKYGTLGILDCVYLIVTPLASKTKGGGGGGILTVTIAVVDIAAYTLSAETASETVIVVNPGPTNVIMSPDIVATRVLELEKDKAPVPVLVTRGVSENGASVV